LKVVVGLGLVVVVGQGVVVGSGVVVGDKQHCFALQAPTHFFFLEPRVLIAGTGHL